jgi:hypothetical protein
VPHCVCEWVGRLYVYLFLAVRPVIYAEPRTTKRKFKSSVTHDRLCSVCGVWIQYHVLHASSSENDKVGAEQQMVIACCAVSGEAQPPSEAEGAGEILLSKTRVSQRPPLRWFS